MEIGELRNEIGVPAVDGLQRQVGGQGTQAIPQGAPAGQGQGDDAVAVFFQRLGVGPLLFGGPQGENCHLVAASGQVANQVVGPDSYEVGDVGDDV